MSRDALTTQEHAAVQISMWRARRALGPGMTYEDMLQEGRMALWCTRATAAAIGDDAHRSNYLQQRAKGAMLDACRTAWRQWSSTVMSTDEIEVDDDSTEAALAGAAPDDPQRIAQLREVVARIYACNSPRLVECLERMAEGANARTVARDMGVDESRVAQFRRQARDIAAECW